MTEFTELDSLFGPLEIINFRRFTRKEFNKQTNKTEIVPTTTVQFTVRGQCLPAEVKIYKVIYPVETYFPQIRQCYRCFKFGHIKINCKSAKELCIRCGQTNHKDGSECLLNKSQPMCLHCQENHLPIHKNGPVWKKEQKIRNIATTHNVTVAEVKSQINKKSFFPRNTSEFPSISNPTYSKLPSESNLTLSYADIANSQHHSHTNSSSKKIPSELLNPPLSTSNVKLFPIKSTQKKKKKIQSTPSETS